MNSPVFYPLTNSMRVICFSGGDAGSFLQGQITCDALALNSGDSAFGALCNPKGRAISLFYLLKVEQVFYMLVNKEMAAIIIKRLRMFVFRSDVKINDVSDQHLVIGASAPMKALQSQADTPLAIIPVSESHDLSLLLYTSESPSFINDMEAPLESVSYTWQRLLVNAGIPEIGLNTSELFVPQMLNLDLLNGISFKKGCYTGQEIVARLHYKGTVKRRLVIFNSTTEFNPGDELFSENDTNSIGYIVNCISSDQAHTGLAVLKTSAIQLTALTVRNTEQFEVKRPQYLLALD
ncbi:MAG: folate-binding protein YgfZ [Cycloclasticus sp.]|nr:folate-binding protein YgfZ [Cycloclasticus sp.]MBQ0790380.1 folate-binding protein YgfZ [Cycloclasticus sp.]